MEESQTLQVGLKSVREALPGALGDLVVLQGPLSPRHMARTKSDPLSFC